MQVRSSIFSFNMKNKNIRFFKSVVIVAGVLLFMDFLVGVAGSFIMSKVPDYSGQFAKDNFRLNRVSSDIVVIGSSRGCHHYVSSMLRDSINNYTGEQYTLYNCSIGGKYIVSNSCAAESIMDRYAPKLIIFELFDNEFGVINPVQDMEFAIVNYRSNRFVKQYVDSIGFKERVKNASNMVRFNQKLPRIVSSFLKQGNESGYEPLSGEMSGNLKKTDSNKKNEKKIDKYSLDKFVRVIKTAKEKGIMLIVATSPSYSPDDKNEILIDVCSQYDVPYIDLYDLELFNRHPEYFRDPGHLNDKGAHIYTELFFKHLKPYLEEL